MVRPFHHVSRPSVIQILLRSLNFFSELLELCPPDDQFCSYVSNDGALYLDEIVSSCSAPPPTLKKSETIDEIEVWRSVLILIPLRLGLEAINSVYFDPLQKFFQMPQSVGIIGGKPRAAFYFVGLQRKFCIFESKSHNSHREHERRQN